MSRLTDIERGARLAYDIAIEYLAQLPLFKGDDDDALTNEMHDIAIAAQREIRCCEWARQVIKA